MVIDVPGVRLPGWVIGVVVLTVIFIVATALFIGFLFGLRNEKFRQKFSFIK